MVTDDLQCALVRDLVPELAAGVAAGDARAHALAHMTRCPDCRRRLEDAATLVDELILLAPENEPPPGFESRVLAALPRAPVRPRRRRMAVLALRAAVLVLLAALAAGLTWWRTADDRGLAAHYRQTLAAGDGRYLAAASLVADSGPPVGHVFAYEGAPPWVFVEMTAAPRPGTYAIHVITVDNRTVNAGNCRVRDRAGAYGRIIDVPVSAIQRIELVQPGVPTLTARLR
jgi:hypothetical protein